MIFTDLNNPVIEENIQRNCSLNDISSCRFLPYDWNDVSEAVMGESFDLIISSDCLFENKGN